MPRNLALLCLAAALTSAGPDLLGAPKDRELVIGLWWPPPPAETTEARYREIAASGINLVLGGNGVEGPELSRKMLDLCKAAGLRAAVLDNRIYGGKADAVPEVVKDYASHPALYGYLVKDEPSTREFPALAETVAAVKRHDPKHLALINLLPSYASPEQLGAPTYEEHVKAYVDTVKPEVLCFDHYPLLTQGIRTDFYTNLNAIRRASLKADIPFWCFVQAEGIEGAYRSPSPTEMRWQVYQTLAYGAKGILYFTYWTPEPGVEKHFDGIIGRDGKARGRYGVVRELNAELKALSPVLVSTRAVEVYNVGLPAPGSKTLGDDSPILLRLTGDPATVSYLRGSGSRRYVMVANRELNRSARVSLLFRDSVERCFEILKTGKRGDNLLRPELSLAREVTVALDPGDARLFEIGLSDR